MHAPDLADFEEGLSPAAQQALEAALEHLREFIAGVSSAGCSCPGSLPPQTRPDCGPRHSIPGERQADIKTRALSRLACDGNRAPPAFDDLPDHGKSEPGSVIPAALQPMSGKTP